tara:strand:+ start:1604 stop:2011 length:408 start_codon:yes stop_codon:yes gene_type:complete
MTINQQGLRPPLSSEINMTKLDSNKKFKVLYDLLGISEPTPSDEQLMGYRSLDFTVGQERMVNFVSQFVRFDDFLLIIGQYSRNNHPWDASIVLEDVFDDLTNHQTLQPWEYIDPYSPQSPTILKKVGRDFVIYE